MSNGAVLPCATRYADAARVVTDVMSGSSLAFWCKAPRGACHSHDSTTQCWNTPGSQFQHVAAHRATSQPWKSALM